MKTRMTKTLRVKNTGVMRRVYMGVDTVSRRWRTVLSVEKCVRSEK